MIVAILYVPYYGFIVCSSHEIEYIVLLSNSKHYSPIKYARKLNPMRRTFYAVRWCSSACFWMRHTSPCWAGQTRSVCCQRLPGWSRRIRQDWQDQQQLHSARALAHLTASLWVDTLQMLHLQYCRCACKKGGLNKNADERQLKR